MTRMSVHATTSMLFTPEAGSRLSRRKNLTQPQAEEKDCEARPLLSLLQRSQRDAIFSIVSALDAPQDLRPDDCEQERRDVSTKLAEPFYESYHCHPGD